MNFYFLGKLNKKIIGKASLDTKNLRWQISSPISKQPYFFSQHIYFIKKLWQKMYAEKMWFNTNANVFKDGTEIIGGVLLQANFVNLVDKNNGKFHTD